MAYICERCQQTVEKVISLGDVEATALITDAFHTPRPQYHYYCITCVRQILDITEADLVREERRLSNDTDFHLRVAKGRLAQVVIEIVFLEFGYEVYPFGYESYFTNIIKHTRKGDANIPVRKVRATPDLFVYDREANDGFFLEVKATSTWDESRYWLSKLTLDTYQTHWPEAVLVVYCIPTGNIYCKQISQINQQELSIEQSPTSGWSNYVLNLQEDFQTLSDKFRLIDRMKYENFKPQLMEILVSFGSHNSESG
jgi:DNA-directed RNA polymerase subunit RPC12/RpoP